MIKFFKRKRKLELLKATRSFKRIRRTNEIKRQQYRKLENYCNRERFVYVNILLGSIHTLPEAIIEFYIEGESELSRMERRIQREALISAELDLMFTNLTKEYQKF